MMAATVMPTAMWGGGVVVDSGGPWEESGGKRLRLWLAVDARRGRCYLVRLAELKGNGGLA